jgi:murein DD-endopeptidase MepM/ murein hydrolase activator NlpD
VVALALLSAGAWCLAADVAGAATGGDWLWPVSGAVLRGFEPPSSPYGAGHRGIDLAAPAGTPVTAPEAGVVAFAGRVAGERYLSIAHGNALVSTYSWLSEILVAEGDAVARGAAVATSGRGHPGSAQAHLHFGVRRDGAYVDPLELLSPASVAGLIRLAPLVHAPWPP